MNYPYNIIFHARALRFSCLYQFWDNQITVIHVEVCALLITSKAQSIARGGANYISHILLRGSSLNISAELLF